MSEIPKPQPGAAQYERWHYQKLVRQQEEKELIDAIRRWNDADTVGGKLPENWPTFPKMLARYGIAPSAATRQWLPIFCELWKGIDGNPAPTEADVLPFLFLKRGISPKDALAATLEQACKWLQAILADPAKPNPPDHEKAAPAEQPKITSSGKPKRNNEPDTSHKIIAALTRHHQYADGGCLNMEPVGCNQLATDADVSPATASAFFKAKFEGHAKYKGLCSDRQRLIAALKMLNGEFVPAMLLGDAAKGVIATEEGPKLGRTTRRADPHDQENDS